MIFFLIVFGLPVLIAVGMSLPVWVRTRRWQAGLRAFAVSLFGIVVPVEVFLLASFLQPEWKGSCHFGWVDCFHQGKLILLPLVLWASAGLYVTDVLRRDYAATKGWVRWKLWLGGCLSPAQAGYALLPGVPFWIGSVLASQRLYQALPDVAPSCFVVTAASRGHPWVVGTMRVKDGAGVCRQVNQQLLVFREFEACWQRRAPATHAAFRRFYNVWGYRTARWIQNRWMADGVYLLLKPAEWVVAWLQRQRSPRFTGLQKTMEWGRFIGRSDGESVFPHVRTCGNTATTRFPHVRTCGISNTSRSGWWRRVRLVYAGVLVAGAFYLFLVPGVMVCVNLCDPALREPGIPRQAWRLHRTLVPRFTAWAQERIASGRAGHLPLHDVPSTEWPIFGSVFYLWSTEALQAEWEKQDPARRGPAPVVYARPAIDAAIAVILDPVHHTWVRQHWGDDYLHKPNCFFRSLLIAGVTSYTHLTGDRQHLPLLRDQVVTLCAALDASPTGLLEDYPGECYPIDVICSLACLQRAAALLDLDVRDFMTRARRAFTGPMLDSHGLPPYVVDYRTGQVFECSRGTGNSHTLIFAPELWPDLARDWYTAYEKQFWQDKGWATGFREYPRDAGKPETFFEIDAGPIIRGFSPAANAFGLAATRRNGRFDHAYTLAAQVITASWPLPNGTLLGCRILSSVGGSHAPYLGETALLFHLTQNPIAGVSVTRGGHLPLLVWIGLAFYFGVGGLWLYRAWQVWRRTRV
ncbi:MAG: DUF6688 family protein [Kiritimatiellia bacterium]